MRANLIAGLDIGTSKICAVIGEVSGDPRAPELTVLGVGQARTGGLRGDTVINIEEMTESVRSPLKEAELMAGAAVDRVYAGVGGDHIRASSSMGVVAISNDEVMADDIERVHIVARAVALSPDHSRAAMNLARLDGRIPVEPEDEESVDSEPVVAVLTETKVPEETVDESEIPD